MADRRLRLCYVVSSEMTVVTFLKDHITAAIAAGYEVSVVAHAQDDAFLRRHELAVAFHSVAIVRPIAPWRDFKALMTLSRLFYAKGFDIVHSVSPKAGILAILAARITGVPHRVHTFTGQVWVTRTGIKRWLLKSVDCLLASMTTEALVDSPSQKDFLISEGVVKAHRAHVIGLGSICGVDSLRFQPDGEARRSVRGELGIPLKARLILFLGRLTHDKGVLDLAKAFAILSRNHAEAHLVMVGPDEGGLAIAVERLCASAKERVHLIDFTDSPQRYMASADVFCLPSYREGFGMVIMEAAATGVPCVASRIYGITDAVIDECTGLLHPPGDIQAIANQLSRLLTDPALCLEMGQHARIRAMADFSQIRLTQGLMAFYEKIVN